MTDDQELYKGREQTRIKHEILRMYIERFAHIVGSRWPSITYIDGFSGPWGTRADDLSDSSFSIAIEELRKAKGTLRDMGKDLAIRCVFVEKNVDAFERLKMFAESVGDAEILTIKGEFETAIPEIIEFVKKDTDTFPFTLIDPTGSTGFSMNAIEPLLSLKPGEVLINFMIEFIRRYIEQQGLRKALTDLFGVDDFDSRLAALEGDDRDDEITNRYCQCLSESCNFPHVLRASVLHQGKDRLYFQLVYATRDLKGVEVFKDTERRAMKTQEDQRAQDERERKQRGGQGTFLDFEDPPESRFYNRLRARYLRKSKSQVIAILNRSQLVDYDQVWVTALMSPMVWQSDLNEWLEDWKSKGLLDYHGLTARERTLKRSKGHKVERLVEIVE